MSADVNQPDPAKQIADAERDAAEARVRVTETLGVLQDKLNPKRVARQALHDATEKGSAAAQVGVDAARRNPRAAAGAAAVAVLFLARRRIARLFRRKLKETPAPSES